MKTFKLRHLREVKTTIIGLVFLAVALIGIFEIEDFKVWFFIILIFVGILMLFSPNALITSLIKFMRKNDEIDLNKRGNS